MPDSLYTANESQIDQLHEIDAAALQLFREKIPAVYRVISPPDYTRIFGAITKWTKANPDKPWSPKIEKLVREDRERLALNEIKTFFRKNPKQRDVILIYGSKHNFSIYPDLFNPACVAVPYQFQRDWLGKNRGGYENLSMESSGSARGIK